MKANRLFWLAAAATMIASGCSDDASMGGGKIPSEKCSTGMEACGASCVDFQTDVLNCGGCGIKCEENTICVQGNCELNDHPIQCEEGTKQCGTNCVDEKTDVQNCGACGHKCGENELCIEGSCEPTDSPIQCESNENVCGTECVHFLTDAMHCGDCNTKCNEDEKCDAGLCVAKPSECVENKTLCGDGCYDLSNDDAHCGSCDKACASDERCKASNCEKVCEAGQLYCGGTCVDPLNDDENCGSCDNVCVFGTECKAGACENICAADRTYCNDKCVDLVLDSENCGECGNACVESQKCSESHCVDKCEAGETYVNGNCYNLDTDNDHCGVAMVQCVAGTKCTDGVCVSVCAVNETYCGDSCVDLESDKANCGTCGEACGAGLVCSKGTCRKDCGDLLVCGDLCVDGLSNTTFCGAKGECNSQDSTSSHYAGVQCKGDEICSNGVCQCQNTADSLCLAQDGSLFCTSGASDTKHCGCNATSTGMNCSALSHAGASTCGSGSCNLVCDEGYADCDGNIENGCETSLNDINSCGACGNKCDTTYTVSAACVAGKCELKCFENLDTCGGTKCVPLFDDENCGTCGNKCDEKSSCDGKVCLQDKCDADGYTTYTTPDGKSVRAYCIGSIEALSAMRDAINTNTVYPASNSENAYLLTANIQINDENWESIGNVNHPFTGKFYGNTRSITSSRMFDCKSNYCGLFGRIVGASATDRAVVDGVNADLYFNAKNNYVGVLSGSIQNADITRCHVSGNITAVSNAGGLIGSVVASNVSDSSAHVNVVTTKDMAGGIFGFTEDSTITQTKAFGNVTGNTSVGGHTGYAKKSTISQSSASGSAKSTGTTGAYGFGGFVGTSEGSTFILDSASGFAEGYYSVGGFLGRGIRTTTVKQCAAFGTAQTSTVGGVGGVAGVDHGDKLILESTFSTGNVINGYAGSVYGSNDSGTTTLTNSYGTGIVKANYPGYICGGFTGSGSITANGTYGWVSSAAKAMGTSQGLSSNSTYGTFEYVDGKPMVGNTSLFDVLKANYDVWEEKECTLTTGPGTENNPLIVKLPVLKGIDTFNLCK